MLLKKTVINKPLKKYFSEIEKNSTFKKINFQNYHIKIFLGGKGRGKSYLAFEEMYKLIRAGKLVAYMRNSLDEIKQIKGFIAQEIKNKCGFISLRVSDEYIIDRISDRVLVTFISVKNYNKISGNAMPYSYLFYDEFNQEVSTKMSKLIADFFNIIQTLFRANEWNIVACGNTKTRNNLLFNLFQINLRDIEDNIEIYTSDENMVGIVRYKDSAFSELNMDHKDLKMVQKLAPQVYNSMFDGTCYEYEDKAIINDGERIKDNYTISPERVAFVVNNRIFQLYEHKERPQEGFIHKEDAAANVNNINTLIAANYKVLEVIVDYYNLAKGMRLFRDELNLIHKFINKLATGLLFFDAYDVYLEFKETDGDLNLSSFKTLVK